MLTFSQMQDLLQIFRGIADEYKRHNLEMEKIAQTPSFDLTTINQYYEDAIRAGWNINKIYHSQTIEGKVPWELRVSKRTIAKYRDSILAQNKEIK